MSTAVPLPAGGPVTLRELAATELPRVQSLFEASPDYFLLAGGRPPGPDEAREQFAELPPPEMPYTARWYLGLHDAQGMLRGVADVVSDLLAPGVWHVGFFFVDGAVRGSGFARDAYTALEQWMRAGGARWLRLGVIIGNVRAERFWRAQGFVQVRVREQVDTGGGTRNDVHVMAKALCGEPLDAYLAQVPRDRPDAAAA